jgi:hypothetical protein
MPKKELHLHNRTHATQGGGHWYDSHGYDQATRDAMPDPAGGDTREAPTSIPSPFARFDLVKTAFRRLAQRANLGGEPNDLRLVSGCFDIGEIFFHFEQFRERSGANPNGFVRMLTWEKSAVQRLVTDSSVGHRRLGKALDLYLRDDAHANNFEYMHRLFLLYYQGPTGKGFIGGTSPTTLFFTAPGDLGFVDIRFGNHRVFDPANPVPLHERDLEYQTYWHGLANAMPHFRQRYKDVADYLDKSLNLLFQKNGDAFNQIKSLTAPQFESRFPMLLVPGTNQPVELLTEAPGNAMGYPLRQAEDPTKFVQQTSQLLIRAPRYAGQPTPMVLAPDAPPVAYAKIAWVRGTEVPHHVPQPWRPDASGQSARRLPGQSIHYPWLTVSDLLEPNLLRLVYPVNKAAFFDGNLSAYGGHAPSRGYLLPLKPDFFEFFGADALQNGTVKLDIREVFRQASPDGMSVRTTVEVALSVPVVAPGQFVTLRKTYEDDPNRTATDADLRGSIAECQVGVAIFPFVQIQAPPPFQPQYRVHVVDRDVLPGTYNQSYRLSFYGTDNRLLPNVTSRPRSEKGLNLGAKTEIYDVRANFERISVEVAGRRGVVLPVWPARAMGTRSYAFAVDFGTTNTHIEYRVEGGQTQPFTIDTDVQLATLFDPAYAAQDASLNGTGATAILTKVPMELLPERIGPGQVSRFPQRTALLENNPNFSQDPLGFGDFNIAFLYERKLIPTRKHNSPWQNGGDVYELTTDLKWSEFGPPGPATSRVEAFLESLMMLMRNKVLLNGGDLARTQLVWFYPLSMSVFQRGFIDQMWQNVFAETFAGAQPPLSMPESIAPFYFFQAGGSTQQVTAYSHPAVLVDIGGGTSDITVFAQNKPVVISSARFAANAIFGDGFSTNGAASNGFVNRYEKPVKDHLAANGLSDLLNAYEEIKKQERSDDIVAFFFSLKTHADLVQQGKTYDFEATLTHDRSVRVVFLVFYAALMYHVARLMQAKGLGMPRYLTFSGNGSKVLNILSHNDSALAQLAKAIFEKVYNQPYHADGLDLVRERNIPKEVTCKGGLLAASTQNPAQLSQLVDGTKAALLGTTDERLVSRADTYASVDDAVLTDVASEVKSFVELLFSLDFPFQNYLGVDEGQFPAYKARLLRDLRDRLAEGWEQRRRPVTNPNAPLEESLFFLPLIAGLNDLAKP